MRRFAVALVAMVAMTALSAAVRAQSTLPEKIAACRLAATNMPAPADFVCDWSAITKGAPGAALVGRYRYRAEGHTGGLAILDIGEGPALVGISTTHERTGHTCILKARGSRKADDALTVTSNDDQACTIRIRASGRNEVRVTASNCRAACGLRAGFEGSYRVTAP